MIDTIALDAPPENAVVRLSGVALSADGEVIIADASERTVQRFDRSGRFATLIGRDGDGPGEFREPRFVVPTADDGLLVGEGTGRIHWYRRDSILSAHQLDGSPFITGLILHRDSLVVVSSFAGDTAVLRIHSKEGRLLRTFAITSGVPVRDQPDNPRWMNFWSLRIAACGGSAAIIGSVSDSVWYMNLDDGSLRAERVAPIGYRAPSMTEAKNDIESADMRRRFEWIREYDVAQGLICSGAHLGFSYVRGVRNYGDPQTFLLRRPSGRWSAFSDAPPVMGMRGDTLVTLLRPESDRVVLGLFVPRPR